MPKTKGEPKTVTGKLGKQWALAGLCRQCGKPRERADISYCNFHREYRRVMAAKRYRDRKASGKCVMFGCGKRQMANYVYCEAHTEYYRAANYKRFKAKRGNP